MEFCFTNYHLNEIVAGCYEDNIKSIKLLTRLGFIRNEKDDNIERCIFTDKEIVQLAFRIMYEDYIKRKN